MIFDHNEMEEDLVVESNDFWDDRNVRVIGGIMVPIAIDRPERFHGIQLLSKHNKELKATHHTEKNTPWVFKILYDQL